MASLESRVEQARGLGLDLTPPKLALLDDPLEFIQADHARHRVLCAALRRYAANGAAPEDEARRAVAYLAIDLPLHHRDEDEDLFPALRRRAVLADDLGAALTRLAEDHRTSQSHAELITDALSGNAARGEVAIGEAAQASMRSYASSEHRHLAIENAVILTIARIRLTRGDLAAMSRAMAIRRGL